MSCVMRFAPVVSVTVTHTDRPRPAIEGLMCISSQLLSCVKYDPIITIG